VASITRAAAKIYVARILGGAGSTQILDAADEAIKRGAEDWDNAHNWSFLLKDTADGSVIASCALDETTAVVAAPSTGAFDGLNVGLTVTGTSIPASTTILSLTRNSAGDVTHITLSANPVVSGAPTTSTESLTFSGNIPIIAGTQEYNAPRDFGKPYGAELLTAKWPLSFIEYREWNRKVVDKTAQGAVEAYTVYNPRSVASSGSREAQRIRVFRIPGAADTMFLQYYRGLDGTADPIDMFSGYTFKFLDYCRWLLVLDKTAHDDRLPQIEKRAQSKLQMAITDDSEKSEDQEIRLISQMEAGSQDRPLWSNGQFNQFYGE